MLLVVERDVGARSTDQCFWSIRDRRAPVRPGASVPVAVGPSLSSQTTNRGRTSCCSRPARAADFVFLSRDTDYANQHSLCEFRLRKSPSCEGRICRQTHQVPFLWARPNGPEASGRSASRVFVRQT